MRQDSNKLMRNIAAVLIFSGLANANVAMADGAEIYNSTCVVCHGADGKGVLPGVPDLTESAGRLTKADDELFNNVVNGFQSPGSSMAMPAKGGNTSLSNEDMKTVLKYMKQEFSK